MTCFDEFVMRSQRLSQQMRPVLRTVGANNAVDLAHGLPACELCDLVLLDSAWCNRVRIATKRIRSAGIKDRLAACYSPRMLPEFFTALEALRK